MAKLLGILNATSNSFSDGGKYATPQAAIERVKELFHQGADVVDIGAASTSYGVKLIPHEEEWEILEPILAEMASSKISVDTYQHKTAEKAIELGVGYINDVSFGLNKNMLSAVAGSDAKYILMFSLVLPANKSTRVKDILEIEQAFERKLEECVNAGIKLEQIIIDPGIGFGTTPAQSFEVIQNVDRFKRFGAEILIGHSRKSFFEMVTDYSPIERDLETLVTSLYLKDKVDYLRVHNIHWHKRAFKLANMLNF
jgi:dihydropteroate synthase